jgi:hypothetical protein
LASAVETTLMSSASVNIGVGESFTVDLAIDNVSLDRVNAVEVVALGLFAMDGVPIGGRAARDILVQPISGGGFFGISAVDNSFIDPDDFSNTAPPQEPTDIFFLGAWIGGPGFETSIDGALDGGIDGTAITDPQPRDITLTVLAQSLGNHLLVIQTRWVEVVDGGTELRTLPLIEIPVVVVPEPGTAMLLGLGLIGLRARGGHRKSRRRRHEAAA